MWIGTASKTQGLPRLIDIHHVTLLKRHQLQGVLVFHVPAEKKKKKERLSMKSYDNTFLSLSIFILDLVRNPSDVFVSFIMLPLFSCVFFPLWVEITFHFKAKSECNISWRSFSCQSKWVDGAVAVGITELSDGGVSTSVQMWSANEDDPLEVGNSGSSSHFPDIKMWNNYAY